MATLTASTYLTKQITNAPPGLNVMYGQCNLGATTLSVGDVILLAKIPKVCKIVEFLEDHTLGNTTGAFDFGVHAADLGAASAQGLSAICTNVAKATLNRLNKREQMPVQVNATATDRDFSILKAKYLSTTGTTSLKMRWQLIYLPNDTETV